MTSSDIKLLIDKVERLARVKLTTLFDFIAFKLGVKTGDSLKITGTVVYYIGENLPPRIARMVKWLKRNGSYTSVLICAKDGFSSKYTNQSFDKVVLFRNEWHLKRILSELPKPSLIHGFGPKSFFPDVARTFLPKVKFVYDMQDVLAIYYGLDVDIAWYKKEFIHERNCLAFSQGLVSHALEPIPAYKLYKIPVKNNRMFFPLYCDDDFFESKRKKLDKENISVVYAGEVQGSGRDKRQFGNVQFFDLIEILSKQRIHFHIYPSPVSQKVFIEEYKQLAKTNPYLHLHEPVAQSELARELSQYTFGFIPFFKTNTGHLDYKHVYSTSLKLFNFIEAGIPILISKDITFQNWIACRYKAGISIERDDIFRLREIAEQVDYDKMLNELWREREKIGLKKNIHRLAAFYNRVLATN